MNAIHFQKMHGLGNDFVIVDARAHAVDLTPDAIRRIADRHTGVGCDQFIRMEPSRKGDVFMRIWNPDGSQAQACGNATRCVARLLMDETGSDRVVVETVAGLLASNDLGDGVCVDMGEAKTGWRDIPLAHDIDTVAVDLGGCAPSNAVCVNMGNPHAVLFVEDCNALDLEQIGRTLEHHPMFPERANISLCTVETPERIRMRVWERGVGATLACGSAACAVVVAGVRRGLTERRIVAALPGGDLDMTWREDGHVLMAGPTAHAYDGTLSRGLVA